MKYDPCPICFSPVNQSSIQDGTNGPQTSYDCPRCGRFVMSLDASAIIGNQRIEVDSSKVANMAGWIRKHQGILVQRDDIQLLNNLPTPTPAAKAVFLLSYLASKHPIAGQDFVPIDDSEIQAILSAIKTNEYDGLSPQVSEKMPKVLEICGVCSIATREEYDFIIRDVLERENEWLTRPAIRYIRISPKGWEFLDSLKRVNPDSESAFVAMRIHPDMEQVYEAAISVGIENAGYEPILITKTGHTNRIDDEIIAEIKRSRFVVADYTGQRQSVYYESGYAKALGLKVFWLCDKTERKELHFDVEHYSFLFYERENLAGLHEDLTNWILANFPQGPYGRGE